MVNKGTETLIEKVELIAKYYYKGFGATMDGILDNIDAYTIFDCKEVYSERAYRLLNQISHFYKRIPFADINDPEFYPLFVVNKILPQFKKGIEDYFDKPTERGKNTIRQQGESIVEVGRLYDDSLHSILKEIRVDLKYKDFRVRIIDDKNQEWNF